MMKTRHLLAAAAVFSALGIVSCKRSETVIRTYESDVEQNLAFSDSAGVTIHLGVEYLESFEGGKSICAKVNNLIARFCFGDEYDGMSLQDAAREYSEALVADYRKDAGETFNEAEIESYPLYNWYYVVSGHFAESYGDLLTYTVFSENYLGGAHGMRNMIPHVINLKTGEEVDESMMFVEGYEEPVSALIRQTLQKEWGSPDDPGSTYCAMEEDGMVPNGFFSVSEEGVTWYYQPYVIASYAQGIIEAKVSWYDLKPYVNRSVVKP